MCWSATASMAMVGAGAGATAVCIRRGEPRAVSFALGYFTLMEALQAAGYAVVDDCGSAANRTITLLSYLHIAFQPLVINAFAMELVPGPVRQRIRTGVFAVAAASAGVMLLQLAPGFGACRAGDPMCAEAWCLRSGEWHIAWEVPYNAMMAWADAALGTASGFPTYVLSVFLLPVLYGAWRFVVFHAVAGPMLALALTGDPDEMPAVWCLFSIGILVIALSPAIRRRFEAERWWAWPRGWLG